MGADFVFAVAPACADLEAGLRAVDSLPLPKIEEVADWRFGEVDEDTIEDVRELLREGVRILSDEELGRDTGWFIGTDATIYILTGGMTWGDSPTEACDPIWAVQVAELKYPIKKAITQEDQ